METTEKVSWPDDVCLGEPPGFQALVKYLPTLQASWFPDIDEAASREDIHKLICAMGWLSVLFIPADCVPQAGHNAEIKRAIISGKSCAYGGAILRHTYLKHNAASYIFHKALTVYVLREDGKAFEKAIRSNPALFGLSCPACVSWTPKGEKAPEDGSGVVCLLSCDEMETALNDVADPTEDSDSTYIRYSFTVAGGATAGGYKFYRFGLANIWDDAACMDTLDTLDPDTTSSEGIFSITSSSKYWDRFERTYLPDWYFAKKDLEYVQSNRDTPDRFDLFGSYFVLEQLLSSATMHSKEAEESVKIWIHDNIRGLLGGSFYRTKDLVKELEVTGHLEDGFSGFSGLASTGYRYEKSESPIMYGKGLIDELAKQKIAETE